MIVKEFEHERKNQEESHSLQLHQATNELNTLRRCYELQSREMTHVKRLAKRVLDQRSDMEQFFLEALSHVRKEIANNRSGICCDVYN